jgi:hypothetical protein
MPILSSDISTKVKYYSGASIDKIIGVWEGTYNKATETTTRTDGIIGSIKVFSIPHTFTRPMFTSLLWSEDGTTWVDGGGALSGGNSSIAFSNSSNNFIATNSTSGTQYYKLIGYWIDDYDTSNPSVESYVSANKDTKFDSRLNYQKIALSDSTTYSAGTFGSVQTVQIPHPLGYMPNAKVFFEPISGEVWPLISGGVNNPFLYDASQDEGYMQIYSDRIDVVISRFSNASRRIWHRIYYDA